MNNALCLAEKKRIESFYLLKAISSFFVVTIHCTLWQSQYLNFIIGIGTPCFLAITGYLLYSDNEQREIAKCIKWAKKTFILALICNLVYAVSLWNIDLITSPKVWLYNIFFSGKKFCYALWYLTALWQGLLIFSVLRKYAPRLIYLLPALFIILFLMRNANTTLIPFSIPMPISRMSVLTTLTFLPIGYLIRKYEHFLLKRINVEKAFVVFLILAFIENIFYIIFLDHRGLFHFTTLPLITLCMLLCIKYPNFKLPLLNTIGKKHSANIYYFHVLVIIFIWDSPDIRNIQAILVWLTSIPISMIFIITTTFFHIIYNRYCSKQS